MLETLDISILSFLILLFIHINAYHPTEKVFTSYRLFIMLVKANMLLIAIDILGWAFNGLPGNVSLICNWGFNMLLYIAATFAPALWVLYMDYQVYQDEMRLKKAAAYLGIVLLINAALAATSPVTGWYFYVDAGNIYHRGEYFLLYVALTLAPLIYSFFFVLFKRRTLQKKQFLSLLFFFLPPLTGAIVQTLHYGVTYNWAGMMLSVLFIYFNIQNRGLNTDYLTGAYNRRQLDGYAKSRIRSSMEEASFSAISLDLDRFKEINDRFGHDTGDEALKDAVSIIQQSLRRNDFVARVGGDEFVVVLDAKTRKTLEEVVQRIRGNVEKFNRESNKPYKISFSMGYAVYNAKTNQSLDDFFKKIDTLMYQNKKAKENVP